MKPLAAALLAIALASSTARADERAHRVAVAGAALTAIGAVIAVGAVAPVSYGAAHVPIDVHHGCMGDNCVLFPTNWPLDLGAPLLAIGAVALGSGIALYVVANRER